MGHPDFETLVKYIGEQLAEDARTAVERHLALPCRQCAGSLARLRTVLETAGQDQTAAPPEVVLRQAVDGFDKRPLPAVQPGLRVLARMAFDSHLQLSLSPVRGTTSKRQLLFTTEQVDIDLQITPEKGDHRLVGQILGTQSAPATAFVSLNDQAGEALQGTETDAHGQFSFQQIEAGVYDLVFDLAGQEVAITSLEFRNDPG